MGKPFEIEVAGEHVVLCAEHAVWWPAESTLIVADLHLGKEQAFASLGIGVPMHVLDETLARLAECIRRTDASRGLVVGDLLHAQHGTTTAVIERVVAWRAGLTADFVVVPGNHDRGIAGLVEPWGLHVEERAFVEGPFRFLHEPDDGDDDHYTWAGHLHPGYSVRGGGESLRLPCFRIGPRVGVLPAFSRFTGRSGAMLSAADRVYVVADDRVVAVQPRKARSR